MSKREFSVLCEKETDNTTIKILSSPIQKENYIEEQWIEAHIDFFDSEENYITGINFLFYKTSELENKKGVFFHIPDIMGIESVCIVNKSFLHSLQLFSYSVYISLKDFNKDIVKCQIRSDKENFNKFVNTFISHSKDYICFNFLPTIISEFFGNYKLEKDNFLENFYSLFHWITDSEKNHLLKNNVIVFK